MSSFYPKFVATVYFLLYHFYKVINFVAYGLMVTLGRLGPVVQIVPLGWLGPVGQIVPLGRFGPVGQIVPLGQLGRVG